MSATVLLSSYRPRPVDDLPIAFDLPANDRPSPRRFEPEEPILVSFEGLSGEEAARALRSFPGGHRALLATL